MEDRHTRSDGPVRVPGAGPQQKGPGQAAQSPGLCTGTGGRARALESRRGAPLESHLSRAACAKCAPRDHVPAQAGSRRAPFGRCRSGRLRPRSRSNDAGALAARAVRGGGCRHFYRLRRAPARALISRGRRTEGGGSRVPRVCGSRGKKRTRLRPRSRAPAAPAVCSRRARARSFCARPSRPAPPHPSRPGSSAPAHGSSASGSRQAGGTDLSNPHSHPRGRGAETCQGKGWPQPLLPGAECRSQLGLPRQRRERRVWCALPGESG